MQERRHLLEPLLRSGLYVITDPDLSLGRPTIELVKQALEGGAGAIQLRNKKASKRELITEGSEIKALCQAFGALFIVNDHADVAVALDADGVHLGQEDLPAEVARRILGSQKIVGCSAHTIEEALEAERAGADYLGVGTIFPTASKEKIRLASPGRISEIKMHVKIPIVAIGGIKATNADQVLAAGADAVAVITAVVSAPNPREAAAELVALVNNFRQERR